MAAKATNYQYRLLYAIGIALVLCGHFSSQFLSWGGTFSYDTFHMPLFAFASGYFYSVHSHESECNVGTFIAKKVKRLLIPYFLWNAAYVLVWVLCNKYLGLRINEALQPSVKWFLVEPFQLAKGTEYNVAAWWLMALFIMQVANVVLRFCLEKGRVRDERVVTCIYLVLAIGAIVIAQGGWKSEWKISLTRSAYLMFWYQVGHFWRTDLEARVAKINPLALIGGSVLLSVALSGAFGFKPTIVYTASFGEMAPIVLLRAAAGIVFWVTISKLIVGWFKPDGLVMYMGSRTFSLMMHQAVVGKLVVWFVARHLAGNNFDLAAFQTKIWYNCAGSWGLAVVVPICVTVVILLGCKVFDSAKAAVVRAAGDWRLEA